MRFGFIHRMFGKKDGPVYCDVCNAQMSKEEGEELTAEVFRHLLNNGFGIDEANIEMLVSSGISRARAVEALAQQYATSESSWLLCPSCIEQAKTILFSQEQWIDENHIAVTRTAQEVGLGYDIIAAPVALTRRVWKACVEWSEVDTETQCYQEQDSRLWDVLFTGGGTLQVKLEEFFRTQRHSYRIECIPKDGQASTPVQIALVMRPRMVQGNQWIVIDLVE